MRKFALLFAVFAGLALALGTAESQDKAQPKLTKDGKHGLGHIPPHPAVSAARHRMSNAIHGAKLKALPDATELQYDAYALGYVLGPFDQGQCGDCHLWSAAQAAANAYLRAGNKDVGMLSVQYLLDYYPQLGGCNGGLEWEDGQIILHNGIPSLADYPGAGQGQHQRQPIAGKTLWKTATQFYVDPNQTEQGVASTQSIKNAIKAYGYVSVACAAGSWSNPGASVMRGPNDGIDHAVGVCGWKTENGKTIWRGVNQWSKQWGDGGFMWIQEGSFGFGTGAFACTVAAPPIPDVPLVAPYFDFAGAAPVGDAAGYPDVASASAVAQTYADANQATVTVKDSKGVVAATISPTPVIPPPPPPPPPLPPAPQHRHPFLWRLLHPFGGRLRGRCELPANEVQMSQAA